MNGGYTCHLCDGFATIMGEMGEKRIWERIGQKKSMVERRSNAGLIRSGKYICRGNLYQKAQDCEITVGVWRFESLL